MSQKTNNISPLIASYQQAVASGALLEDSAQQAVITQLDGLRERLTEGGGSLLAALSKLFDRQETISGMYIWGDVGRGKSMMMDLFFAHTPDMPKRRVHFHAFMQEVHERIHTLRSHHKGDPVSLLAKELAEENKLLCFDELQATDVAGATLLYRLFSLLFEAGVVMVSTSNRPPAELYTGGVQRERFAKFITLIEEHMQVVSLNSQTDYRTQKQASLKKRYIYPLGPEADAFIGATLGPATHAQKAKLHIHGRDLEFLIYPHNTVRFTFAELCETPLGAADYLALAKRCDRLVLENIPALPPEKRNEAKRFVTLIDALYEHKVTLITTAAVPAQEIYTGGDGSFEFSRTVSRLMEMQSEDWRKEIRSS